MRIVCFHVDPVVPHCDTAIDMPGGIVDQSFRNRPRMVPHHASGARIEGGGVVRRGYEHHSIYYNWSDLLAALYYGHGKTHSTSQSGKIRRIDFREAAETSSRAIVSVVGDPISRRRLNQKVFEADIDCCGYARGSGIASKSCPACENNGNERSLAHATNPSAIS